MTSGRAAQGYRPDKRKKRPWADFRPDYRWLADQCRQAAGKVPTEKERNDLLSRAKTWDFLAEHCPHHPALNEG
jgi:hypothetical protein